MSNIAGAESSSKDYNGDSTTRTWRYLITIIERTECFGQSWDVVWYIFYVAKNHLGKVKLEQVDHRPSPTSVCDLRGGPRGTAGLLECPFASVALHCSFACWSSLWCIALYVMVSCLKIGFIFSFQLLVSKVCNRLSRVEMNQSQNCLITLLVSKGTLSSSILY